MIQTDLYSFSYKKGSLLPCVKRVEHNIFTAEVNSRDIQQYQCRRCDFRFVWTSDLPRRNFFSSIMSFAVELYTTLRIGISFCGVDKILKKAFNVKVSYEAIRQLVLSAKHKISRRQNPVPTTWHADGTYFKAFYSAILKNILYFWNILYFLLNKRFANKSKEPPIRDWRDLAIIKKLIFGSFVLRNFSHVKMTGFQPPVTDW